jgi:peptide/nickel transport system substrate-binding protein
MNDDIENITQEDLSGPVIDRRTTMKLLSAAGMGALAGCSGGGGDGDGETDTGTTAGGDDMETTTEGDETATTQGGSTRMGGRLTAGWFEGAIDTLDPPFNSDFDQFPIIANIFNGLIWLAPDLTVRADLATDWEVSNEGKTFTFQLREGVKFHNGTDFTAEDVKYTINRTIAEETPAAPKLAQLQPVDDGGVVVQDDYTVQINFEQAFAPALIYLTRGPGRAATIVNQEAIEEMGNEEYATNPVGTGPFQVANYQAGEQLVLDRFDDYFKTDEDGNQLPYLDGVTINLIPEPSTVVNAIRSGDVDFIHSVPLQNVDQVEQASEVEMLTAPGVAFEGLIMNTAREPFGDVRVRQAIAKLIDKEKFVETAYFGNALPDVGPINKATGWVWREDKPDFQNYDPEGAKQLLEEAGATGASFSITTTEGGLRGTKAVRQQLNAGGLNVEINQVTGSAFTDILFNSDFDTTIVGSGGDPDPDQSLYNFFRLPESAGGDGVWNFGKWENQEVHEMMEEQRTQLDREERKQTLQDAEDIIIEEAPFAFLDHSDDLAAKRPNMKGYTHIAGVRYFENVWLDT